MCIDDRGRNRPLRASRAHPIVSRESVHRSHLSAQKAMKHSAECHELDWPRSAPIASRRRGECSRTGEQGRLTRWPVGR